MNRQKVPERFAFGRNEVDGCGCPAMVAGFRPDGNHEYMGMLEAAECYDQQISAHFEDRESSGTVNSDIAEEMWLKNIDGLCQRFGENSKQVLAAEKVAKELGWLDE